MNSLPPASRKRQYVQEGFNRIAPMYDRLNDCMTAGMHRRWKTEAVRRLQCPPGGRILDVCSGTGDLAIRSIPVVGEQGTVVAFDFAWQMMSQGRRSRSRKNGPLHWMCGDAQCLPFADETFDGVVVGFGLRNLVDMDCGLREIRRVLKPGARLVTLDTAPAEWKPLQPFYSFYMHQIVPRLGGWLTGTRDMYAYLACSAEAFDPPEVLQARLERCGYISTGYAYRPPVVGGAALVWGEKPPGDVSP